MLQLFTGGIEINPSPSWPPLWSNLVFGRKFITSHKHFRENVSQPFLWITKQQFFCSHQKHNTANPLIAIFCKQFTRYVARYFSKFKAKHFAICETKFHDYFCLYNFWTFTLKFKAHCLWDNNFYYLYLLIYQLSLKKGHNIHHLSLYTNSWSDPFGGTPSPSLRISISNLLDVSSLSPVPAPAVLDDPVSWSVPNQENSMVHCTVPVHNKLYYDSVIGWVPNRENSMVHCTVSVHNKLYDPVSWGVPKRTAWFTALYLYIINYMTL